LGKDIQFLKDLIANSDLTIEPLDLGTQTWTNGKTHIFYTVNSDLKGEIPLSIGNLNELTYFITYGNNLQVQFQIRLKTHKPDKLSLRIQRSHRYNPQKVSAISQA
jgi:uncharacterized membrane protein